MIGDERLSHAHEALRLVAEESRGLDDLLDFLARGDGQRLRRRESCEEMRGNDVDSGVGALSRKNRRAQQLEGVPMIQGGLCVGVGSGETSERELCAPSAKLGGSTLAARLNRRASKVRATELRARRAKLTFDVSPSLPKRKDHPESSERLRAAVRHDFFGSMHRRPSQHRYPLFARFPTPEALAVASRKEVEEIIKSTGFFRNKSKSLVGMAQALVADHGSRCLNRWPS